MSIEPEGEHLFAFVIRRHCAAAGTYAEDAINAAVDVLEARRGPETESLVNAAELAMIRALNAHIPSERVDEFRRLARTGSER